MASSSPALHRSAASPRRRTRPHGVLRDALQAGTRRRRTISEPCVAWAESPWTEPYADRDGSSIIRTSTCRRANGACTARSSIEAKAAIPTCTASNAAGPGLQPTGWKGWVRMYLSFSGGYGFIIDAPRRLAQLGKTLPEWAASRCMDVLRTADPQADTH